MQALGRCSKTNGTLQRFAASWRNWWALRGVRFLGGPENSYRTSKTSWMGHALTIKDMWLIYGLVGLVSLVNKNMGFQPSKVWVNQCDGHFSTTMLFFWPLWWWHTVLASPAPAKHTCVVFACQSLAMTTPLVLKELVERAHDQNKIWFPRCVDV